MIPGPVEVAPNVVAAYSTAPPSHVAPDFIAAFGRSLANLRSAWLAGPDSQPFIVAGSGTLAMEMAACNIVGPGDRVLIVNTGYFSDRMGEILARYGVEVHHVSAEVGDAVPTDLVTTALDRLLATGGCAAVFVTHVDTSTGVRVDPAPIAALACERGVLSVFDGVCATAAETFRMETWGADVYVTASQKAIGLPAGLALMVASPAALAARDRRASPPPLYLDWHAWLPIMRAYEAGTASYFATPATTLVNALDVSLTDLVTEGMEAVFDRHQRVADAMRTAWTTLGLSLVPVRPELAANTLSAILYPAGVDASLLGRIKHHGAIVAGGLHPKIKASYFRVGHMGYAASQQEMLVATVRAVGLGLRDVGCEVDVEGAVGGMAALTPQPPLPYDGRGGGPHPPAPSPV